MKSKYFKAYELVSKEDYEKMGDAKVWEIFDSGVIEAIDTIKENFPNGTMTINNWYWGGDRNWSGLRTPQSPYHSLTSMHSYGKAIDAVFSQYDAEEVRSFIVANPQLFPHVKGIETDISWLHIDTRNRDEVLLFKP
ncbi:MAG: hypothetical protein PHW89_08055 [Sulfurimonas denitrificans]|nr:hypothetical protein [Sulfurimonas denitrificans]